ncbi:hypothetical protein BEK98_25005 [Streptomyces diastatochromogenes]|uniref:Uncharacterized protein n=1 Tax=Streptomyces diastatochromogenes TaxID=42236 RepID=A0A233SAU9_STRDA|nr:hypothetical protein BEK98_25005 [Streptomyces diastatochromogenes]
MAFGTSRRRPTRVVVGTQQVQVEWDERPTFAAHRSALQIPAQYRCSRSWSHRMRRLDQERACSPRYGAQLRR